MITLPPYSAKFNSGRGDPGKPPTSP